MSSCRREKVFTGRLKKPKVSMGSSSAPADGTASREARRWAANRLISGLACKASWM